MANLTPPFVLDSIVDLNKFTISHVAIVPCSINSTHPKRNPELDPGSHELRSFPIFIVVNREGLKSYQTLWDVSDPSNEVQNPDILVSDTM